MTTRNSVCNSCLHFKDILKKIEQEMRQANKTAESMKHNYLELIELKQVLKNARVFFEEVFQ